MNTLHPAQRRQARALAASLALSFAPACGPPSAADLDSTRGGRVDVFFNEPGTRPANQWDPDAIAVMVDLINGANSTLDFAVMGFSEPRVVAAMVAAWDRGVELRMVGDAGHTMQEILDSVNRVSQLIGSIAEAGQSQSGDIGQVHEAVARIDTMTQQNAALVEQLAAAALSLKGQSKQLGDALGTFRVVA